jgi:hypothetical protein
MNLFPKLEKKREILGSHGQMGLESGKTWIDLKKCLERHGRAKVTRKFQVSSYLLF